MGTAFSRSKPAASPQQPCPAKGQEKAQADQALVDQVLAKARLEQEKGTTSPETAAALAAVNSFNQYNEAMTYARAAANVYDPSKPAEGLTTLSNDLNKANAELGLEPGTLQASDFTDDKTGFRAALYKSDATGKYILAFAGTNPSSLVDWKTNIDNGDNKDTQQYVEARALANRMKNLGISVDITGHSKGGGLATEAGLINTRAKVWTFNSAGLASASLARTSTTSFDNLTNRTQAFHGAGEFLTTIQTEKDPDKQIKNAENLLHSFKGSWYNHGPLNKIAPLKILQQDNTGAPVNPKERDAFFKDLDGLISDAKQKRAAGQKVDLFPVAVGQSVPIGKTSVLDNLGLYALLRHTMPQVEGDLNKGIKADRSTMTKYLKSK